MAARCLLRGIGVGAFAFAGVAVAKEAVACSCAGGVKLNWPENDAIDVELDSPIVVSGEVSEHMFGPPEPKSSADGGQSSGEEKLLLVSGTNDPVWLTPLTSSPGLLCAVRYRFASVSAELAPRASYELRHGSSIVARFTTGDEKRDLQAERQAAEALTFEVLGTLEDPAQITTAFVTNVGSQPLYLAFAGSTEAMTHPTRYSAGSTLQLNFGSLVCPEVRVLGAAGDTLVTKVLCNPDRCLKSNGIFIQSTCGGNYAVDIDHERFRALPSGCEPSDVVTPDQSQDAAASGLLEAGDPDAIGSGSVDAREVDASVNQLEPKKVRVEMASRGCALTNPRSQSPNWLSASFVALAASWLARRR